MSVLVISNDVTPGFGVPVAAPGLRAAGIAQGLRHHGHDVTVSVPSGVLEALISSDAPPPPPHTAVVDPRDLMTFIATRGFATVIYCNSNMTPHLGPIPGVRFVYDMFAPKLLETLASAPGTLPRPWQDLTAEKERGLALADEVWVNGHRKLGYAVGWLTRPGVASIRQDEFGFSSIMNTGLLDRISVVEMPVVVPGDFLLNPPLPQRPAGAVRLGVAGYAQPWSSLSAVHPAHQTLVDAGHELHALLPAHWGGNPEDTPQSHLPTAAISHTGPLGYREFTTWVQSMDAMVDVFARSPERHFAMITRSAVALRLGVPILHGVDSEISDIVNEYDAGWVLDPDDAAAWQRAAAELVDPVVVERKRAGARRASTERFAPEAALAQVAAALAAHTS